MAGTARRRGDARGSARRWKCNGLRAGIPLYGVDIRERDLPQETEQMRALNFNKGCYVGQEIVERIRSRGNVHRKFTGFWWKARRQSRRALRSFPTKKKWARSPALLLCLRRLASGRWLSDIFAAKWECQAAK